MKKVILILTLLTAGLFAQESNIELLYRGSTFQEDGGNLYALGGVGLYESGGMALKISPPAPYTLSQTGAVLQAFFNGDIQVAVVVNDDGSDLDLRVESNNQDSALVIDGATGKGIMEAGLLDLGTTGNVSEVLPIFRMIGDADSDAPDVSETMTLTLIPDATPTLAVWNLDMTQAKGFTVGGEGGNAPALLDVNATTTVPSIVPESVDANTGIGRSAADGLSLIAGGVEGIRITEANTIAVTTVFQLGVRTGVLSTAHTLGADSCYGMVLYVTAAVTITLPAIAEGMSITFITIGANAVSIDANDNDDIWLDGTQIGDGNKATNTSTTGDMIVFTYYSAVGWYAASNSWTDGGA